MSDKSRFFIGLMALLCMIPLQTKAQYFEPMAAELLERVRAQQPTRDLQDRLAAADPDELAAYLDTDAKRIAFWTNVYNSYIILVLREDPDLYENRNNFFRKPRAKIAGLDLSFDQIEHGILRGGQFKYGLGFIPNPFADKYVTALQVQEVDPRLHFALNCGAESCPPIEVFRTETLDEQLNRRTRAYLSGHVTYNPVHNKVIMTPLVSWFRGDFGGLSGVKQLLKQLELIPAESNPSIEFEDYDWTLDLQNFVEDAD
ncbi:MAG: DUF547 domain-containing protein [Bacteroidota bacterium]